MPVPRNNQKLRVDIKERVASGKFNLGTPVLDTEYTRVVLLQKVKLKRKHAKSQQESVLSDKSEKKA